MRKTLVILVVALLCAGGIGVAAWRMIDGGESGEAAAEGEESGSFSSELNRTASAEEEGSEVDEAGEGGATASGTGSAASDVHTGEDFSYTTPDQRYVTETQRHQNFFRAVAEGKVRRLEVTRADVRPAGDPDTSYIYFTMSTDRGISQGTFVMKFSGGMWRIAAINQLSGFLQGGTNYMVPSSFEDTLAREIAELQPFLTKVAEGRFAYMEVHTVNRPSDSESVLTGIVVGKGGATVPAEMRLRRDYGIWHLTYVTDPPQ